MKNMSLNYFPRQNKLSLSERQFLADFNTINKNKIANQKLEAFAVFTLIKMAIGNCSESGFFLPIKDKRLNLLASEMLFGIDEKFLKRVLQSCFNNGLFDEKLYDEFNILTSFDIQSEYFFSDTVKERALANISEYKHLIYDSIWQNLKNSGKNEKVRTKNIKNSSENGETKPNETQTKTQTKTQTNNEKEQAVSNTPDSSLQKFSSQFPNKKCEEDIVIPENVDLELLAKKVKESEFLQGANNLSIKWLIEHYNEIILDKYINFKNEKPTQNYTNRNYESVDLNSLFDDLEKVEL